VRDHRGPADTGPVRAAAIVIRGRSAAGKIVVRDAPIGSQEFAVKLTTIKALLKAGHRVMVYNRTRGKAEALAAKGAQIADRVAARRRSAS
jgi:translation initiation factor IF-3